MVKPGTLNSEPETYSIPFCVHQGTMEPMRQGAPAFVEARLEVLMDLWVLVFVLDLRAAFFDADFDRLVVTERDEIVTPAIPAERQVTGGIGAGVEVLVKPLRRRNHDAPRFPVHPGQFSVFGPEQ